MIVTSLVFVYNPCFYNTSYSRASLEKKNEEEGE